MSAAANVIEPNGGGLARMVVGQARRHSWTIGLIGLLIAFLAITKLIQPNYGAPAIQGLAISILPIAFAAVAQATTVSAVPSLEPTTVVPALTVGLPAGGQPDLSRRRDPRPLRRAPRPRRRAPRPRRRAPRP